MEERHTKIFKYNSRDGFLEGWRQNLTSTPHFMPVAIMAKELPVLCSKMKQLR
jgi:hypothetical protein